MGRQPVPERGWLVRDRIPLRQPTLLSGEGAVGKSLLVLHLLAATALGRDWLGFMPEPGEAWYFGAEDDKDELHIRLSGIQKHYNVTFADLVDGGFRMKSLFAEDAILGAPNRSGIIEPTELYNQLYEQAGDIKPKAIAIDASADVFAGNEIDRTQTRQFVGLLRRLAGVCDGSVILLSHPSLTGISTGTGLSGSTAWHNSVRARMYFTSRKTGSGRTARQRPARARLQKEQLQPKGRKHRGSLPGRPVSTREGSFLDRGGRSRARRQRTLFNSSRPLHGVRPQSSATRKNHATTHRAYSPLTQTQRGSPGLNAP